MPDSFYKTLRRCDRCGTQTVHYRHHRLRPNTWRSLVFWPVHLLRAARDPWRCRRCSPCRWW